MKKINANHLLRKINKGNDNLKGKEIYVRVLIQRKEVNNYEN